MNERIRELAEQAGIKLIPMIVDGVEYEYEDVDMDGSEDLQKFAELIVEECAQVSEDDITDGDACCTNTAARIARQIKKHFGVE